MRAETRDWGKRTSLDVYGRTLGILGLGAVGRGVAKRAACGFGMTVLAYDPYWDESFASAYGIQQAQPEEIYHTCDFISLHLPLNERTKGMIGRMQLRMMKPSAVLINTARGGLIDEAALAVALGDGQIFAAGIEPFRRNHPRRRRFTILTIWLWAAIRRPPRKAR